MKKVMAFTLLGILVLFAAGLLAGLHVFEPWNRILVDKPGDPPPAAGEMSWNTYKRAKLALGSFDLVNGLTKHDMESITTYNSMSFSFLVGCLWLVLGFRLVNRWTNHKDKTGGLRR